MNHLTEAQQAPRANTDWALTEYLLNACLRVKELVLQTKEAAWLDTHGSVVEGLPSMHEAMTPQSTKTNKNHKDYHCVPSHEHYFKVKAEGCINWFLNPGLSGLQCESIPGTPQQTRHLHWRVAEGTHPSLRSTYNDICHSNLHRNKSHTQGEVLRREDTSHRHECRCYSNTSVSWHLYSTMCMR